MVYTNGTNLSLIDMFHSLLFFAPINSLFLKSCFLVICLFYLKVGIAEEGGREKDPLHLLIHSQMVTGRIWAHLRIQKQFLGLLCECRGP